MCRIAMSYIFDKFPAVFGKNAFELYYDLACIMYSLNTLNFEPSEATGQIKSEQVLTLTLEECANIAELKMFSKIRMLLRTVDNPITLNDLTLITANAAERNHTLEQFIELATSQNILFDS